MELINFYIQNIIYFLDFPTASDICSDNGNITYICKSIINFTLVYSVILIIFSIFLAKNLEVGFKFLAFSVISIFFCFLFTDKILMKLSNPASYGVEGFIISFYIWGFAITSLLLASLFYFDRWKKFAFIASFFSLAAILIFAIYGRGTYEQYLILTGSFGDIQGEENYKLSHFWASDLAKIIILSAIITIIFNLLSLAYNWVKSGHLSPEKFFRGFLVFLVSVLLFILPIASLPIGDYINKNDVKEAKEYIKILKNKVDKYYLENGEYPKFIGDYIEEIDEKHQLKNPWLLERQEYFTMGVRGTYYFSRAQKYCFLFQNPSADFSYHSLTSMRDWSKYNEIDSYSNVYLDMCDEAYEDEESLFANHLGMENLQDTLPAISSEFNVRNIVPESKKSTQIIHEKIIEYGKEDPEVFEYYKNNYDD